MAEDDQTLEQILELALSTEFPEERETAVRKALEKLRKVRSDNDGLIFLRDDKIGDVEVEVRVKTNGSFVVTAKDDGIPLGYGESYGLAIVNSRQGAQRKKIRVHIPFFGLHGEPLIATGIHARTRDVLTRDLAGNAGTYDSYRAYRGDTPREIIEEVRRLDEEEKKIKQRRYEIDKEYQIRLSTVVEEQIVLQANMNKEIADAR